MGVDRYLVLVPAEMKKWVGGSGGVIKDDITNFFGKRSVVIFLDNGESVGLNPLYSTPFGNYWLA